MDHNLDKIAKELYGMLQTRFPDLKIGGEDGQVIDKEEDIPNARFFDFAYKDQGVVLGTIAITLDQEKGLVLQIGGDLVGKNHPGVFSLTRQLGNFAKPKLMNFKVVNLTKSNLDKRDYEFQAKRKEPTPMEPVMESKLYGTKSISYQDLGEARLVIKHTQPVNTELAAGRTMHIESIYIENTAGERFRYPFKHLNGARALAEHVKHGGNPYDAIGQHITGLSEELAQLRKFKGYVGRNSGLAESMGDITNKVFERIESIKKQVHSLQRKSYYEQFAESFEVKESQEIPETTMNDWIERLTIRTFNEDLKSVFPYIFKIIGESDIPVIEVTGDTDFDSMLGDDRRLDELSKDTLKSYANNAAVDAYSYGMKSGMSPLGSDKDMEARRKGKKRVMGIVAATRKMTKKSPEDKFESFVHQLAEDSESQNGKDTLFSDDPAVKSKAIEELNGILSNELTGGPDGMNAIQSLKGIIDDPEFIHSLTDLDGNLDARPLVQQYILHRQADILPQLHFGTGEIGGGPAEGPAAPLDMSPPADTGAAPVGEPGAVPPAPAPGAAPVGAPPPALAESEEEEEEGMEKWKAKRKFGANGARALSSANKAGSHPGKMSKLRRKFIKAWESGAQLTDTLDFGSRVLTVAEAIEECGLTAQECGYQNPTQGSGDGVHELEDSIQGFWNDEDQNFTIGGTRTKQRIIKGFKNGKYPNATVDDVKNVVQKIEKLDPTAHEQNHIVKLAGVGGTAHPSNNGQAPQHDAASTMQSILNKLSRG